MAFSFESWLAPREIRGARYGKEACDVCPARASCTSYGNGNKMVLYTAKDQPDEEGVWLQDDAAPCRVWEAYNRKSGGKALAAWEEERASGKAGDVTLSARWTASRIPYDHRGCDLGNYRPATDSQRNALSLVRDVCGKKATAAILLGSSGTGKTHLATCALKALGGRYYTEEELYMAWRVRDDRTTRLMAFCNDLFKLPLLVIDEAGKKNDAGFLNFVYSLLDTMCSGKVPWIVCSNDRPEDLYTLYTPALFSRASGCGGYVVVDGPDWRARRSA